MDAKADLEKTIKLLKEVLHAVITMLPRHTAECGVHNAHPSYGDEYCNCKMKELKEKVRKLCEET